MGNGCSVCCKSCLGYNKVNDDDSDDERTSIFKNRKSGGDKYGWERHLMENTVMKGGHVSQAAIVSFKDGGIRATSPTSFVPDRKGVKNILKALKGDVTPLSEEGICLGGDTKVYTPGKLDEGKAIYGTDGEGGGCTIFRSQECVLIVVYTSDPTAATRLASEVAEYMAEQGH